MIAGRQLTRWFLVIGVAVMAGALAGRADVLDDQPYDSDAPRELRGAIRTALWKETDRLKREKDADGKPFVYVSTTSYIALENGAPTTYVTVQRCLPERLVVEHWKYVFERKDKDAEIVRREKVWEIDGGLPQSVPDLAQARSVTDLEIVHDLFSLRVADGAHLLATSGPAPDVVYGAGGGRLQLRPVDPRSEELFRRAFGRGDVDSEVDQFVIWFDPRDKQFLEALERADAGTPPAERWLGLLGGLQREARRSIADVERTPERYSLPRQGRLNGFTVLARTKEQGWIVYEYDPDAEHEIEIRKLERNASVRPFDWAGEIVARCHGPASRALPPLDQDRRAFQPDAHAERIDARLELNAEVLAGLADVKLRVNQPVDRLWFWLFSTSRGAPAVRFLRSADGADLPFRPVPASHSRIYGFRTTNNWFSVQLPRRYDIGETLELVIGYEIPGGVLEGQWQGLGVENSFLPFSWTPLKPIPVRLRLRTAADHEHATLGRKVRDDVQDGWRTSEWTGAILTDSLAVYAARGRTAELEKDGVLATRLIAAQSRDEKADEYVMRCVLDALNFITSRYKSSHPFKEYNTSVRRWFQPAIDATNPALGRLQQLRNLAAGSLTEWRAAGINASEPAWDWWNHKLRTPPSHGWIVPALAILTASWYEEDLDPGKHHQKHLESWHRLATTVGTAWSMEEVALAGAQQAMGLYQSLVLSKYKGPHVLQMLGAYFGDDQLLGWLQQLGRTPVGSRWSGRDLQRSAEQYFSRIAGRPVDLEDYFAQWVRGAGIPEVAVHTTYERSGAQWVVKGQARQIVNVDGKPVEGRFFKNLLVPLAIHGGGGALVRKALMLDGPTLDFELPVDFKPERVGVNEDYRVLFTTRGK